MNKEELHKAAEKYCAAKDEYEGEQWSNDYEELPRAMAEFAEKQIKKMLEGWTDDRIYEFADEKYSLIQDKVTCKWNIILFRDELLKQLEG